MTELDTRCPEGCSREIERLKDRITKLNAGHAAQVEAIVQTREHVEAKLADCQASALALIEQRKQAEAEVERLRWERDRAIGELGNRKILPGIVAASDLLGSIDDIWKADLARRWGEHHD